MLERQKVIRSLCDKVIVFADGNIKIMGLIEVSDFDIDTPKNDYNKILYQLEIEIGQFPRLPVLLEKF